MLKNFQFSTVIKFRMNFHCKLINFDLTHGFRVGEKKMKKYRANVERRFGKSVEEIENELNVAAIMVIFGVTFSSLTL